MIDFLRLEKLARDVVRRVGVYNANVRLDCGDSDEWDNINTFDTEIGIDYADHCRLVIARCRNPSSNSNVDDGDFITLINFTPRLNWDETDTVDLDDFTDDTPDIVYEMFDIIDADYDEWLETRDN